MNEKPLRFGLIGTGRIGQVHAASIAADPDAVLTWVCDPFVEGARSVAARYGGTATESSEQVLASGEVDAVLIASPTPTHVDLISAAVDAGIAVLCEKPIDLDIARGRSRIQSPVRLRFRRGACSRRCG
jgi:myo-inositol 2-dehydrogenase/D-chiro-inositol 1-dehydrogenase